MNPDSGRCTEWTGTRRWHKQRDSLRLPRLLASSPPLLSDPAGFQRLFAGFWGRAFFKHSCRSGCGCGMQQTWFTGTASSRIPQMFITVDRHRLKNWAISLFTCLVLFMIFFFFLRISSEAESANFSVGWQKKEQMQNIRMKENKMLLASLRPCSPSL